MEQLTGQVMLIAGIILLVTIGAIHLFIKSRSKHLPDHERHIMELIIREQEKNKRLGQRVETLEEVLAEIKNELKEIGSRSHVATHQQNDGFNFNLQRQSFLQKNQELVLMLQGGLSVEKAAKASNRSVREVEMVDAVLKQRTNS